MSSTDKCPHCGGSRVQHTAIFMCGSSDSVQTAFCAERTARQKAEAQRDEARRQRDDVWADRKRIKHQLTETRRKLNEALSVASMMRDESKAFRICASIHRDRNNNSAESVALRASELLDRFANHIKAAEKVGGA